MRGVYCVLEMDRNGYQFLVAPVIIAYETRIRASNSSKRDHKWEYVEILKIWCSILDLPSGHVSERTYCWDDVENDLMTVVLFGLAWSLRA
jgi:hypothetical protein